MAPRRQAERVREFAPIAFYDKDDGRKGEGQAAKSLAHLVALPPVAVEALRREATLDQAGKAPTQKGHHRVDGAPSTAPAPTHAGPAHHRTKVAGATQPRVAEDAEDAIPL
eukprot:2766682-Alexandrium_andersonii.AAC.1